MCSIKLSTDNRLPHISAYPTVPAESILYYYALVKYVDKFLPMGPTLSLSNRMHPIQPFYHQTGHCKNKFYICRHNEQYTINIQNAKQKHLVIVFMPLDVTMQTPTLWYMLKIHTNELQKSGLVMFFCIRLSVYPIL